MVKYRWKRHYGVRLSGFWPGFLRKFTIRDEKSVARIFHCKVELVFGLVSPNMPVLSKCSDEFDDTAYNYEEEMYM